MLLRASDWTRAPSNKHEFENFWKDFSSFCLINFNDTTAVENVMQNKNNIIIADCKFNVCEQKTTGKDQRSDALKPVSVTGVEKKPKALESKQPQNTGKTIQISNVQAKDLGDGAKSYESFETKTFVTIEDSGKCRIEQRKSGNCTFSSDLMGVKKFFR